jgi:hypothetical protein
MKIIPPSSRARLLASPPTKIVKEAGWKRLAPVLSTPYRAAIPSPGPLLKREPIRTALQNAIAGTNFPDEPILQGAQWDANMPSFPLLLRVAGHEIGKSFKVGSPGMPSDAPFGGQNFACEKAGNAYNTSPKM